LLQTPVIVPRDFTERPQSYDNNCSIKLDVEKMNTQKVFEWLECIESGKTQIESSWLGNGNTSNLIITELKRFL
jgi:UDP-N-acetylglucosamine 2-epimerase